MTFFRGTPKRPARVAFRVAGGQKLVLTWHPNGWLTWHCVECGALMVSRARVDPWCDRCTKDGFAKVVTRAVAVTKLAVDDPALFANPVKYDPLEDGPPPTPGEGRKGKDTPAGGDG